MFIELTKTGVGKFLVNVDHIQQVWPNGRGCSIYLDDDSHYGSVIEETYPEVIRLLMQGNLAQAMEEDCRISDLIDRQNRESGS